MSPAAKDRLARQMRFIAEAERMKEVFRQTVNAHSRRQENDAEHSWAICLIALTLAEHANQPIDLLRVLRMLLLHDLVEIDAGDTFAYDAAGMADQHARESRAAERIFGLLPDDQAREFRALWDEFESQATPEAKYAVAVDRFQPMLLNCLTDGAAWRKHGVTHDMIVARNRHIARGSKALWEHAEEMLQAAVAAGSVPPGEGPKVL